MPLRFATNLIKGNIPMLAIKTQLPGNTQLYRFMFGVLALLVASVLGYVLGSYFHDIVAGIDLDAAEQYGQSSLRYKIIVGLATTIPIVSITSIIAIAVRTINASVDLRAFLNRGDKWKLVRPALALMSATFLVGFAGLPSHKSTASPAQPEIVLNLLDRIGFMHPAPDSNATFIVTFKHEARERMPDGRFKYGLSIDRVQEMFLEDLARDLSLCNGNDRQVKIELRGFASTSGPPYTTERDFAYRQINLDAAEQRAHVIKSIMEQALSTQAAPSQMLITIRPWHEDEEERYSLETYRRMKQAAGFNDTIRNIYSTVRGRLNRRVDISIVDPGDCLASEKPGVLNP